jgi:formylglycine-generating enzyme required for sulfatase activity
MKTAWFYGVAGVLAFASAVLVVSAKAPGAQCGDGFFPVGHRCCPAVSGDGETCGPSRTCPAPLLQENNVCVAPDVRVLIPETRITVGPSDWEADGVVDAKEIHVAPFELDAFEITDGRIHPDRDPEDGARAAGGLTRSEVIDFCTSRGGRLPSEDEWVAAAATTKGTRYPWGDTGAVCRRAAWGLVDGPCAHGARGPDTAGAHTTGDGPLGVHDLAGNVAEWVSARGDRDGRGTVVGGSFHDQLAADLRVWSRKTVETATRSPTIGGRCAYDVQR